MKGFEEVIKKFPKCAEGYALYAQVTVIFHIFSVASPFFKELHLYAESQYGNQKTVLSWLQLLWKQMSLFLL